MGTGAGPSASWGSRGAGSRGTAGPVFMAAAAGCAPGKQKAPPVAGPSAFKVPTSDRAGTGGIQMFLADIDIEPNVTPLVAFGTL
ncbi:hypothetical protein CEE60_08785 [Stenotrophomonas maltophilia]|uniref:Uncharacterized protein n=1 Tax=Stenotrophomonas maltophilia TaxID=40324 RepID=A0A246HNA2_STEMA|nr:hypothetical protein CEE60_08785 [Stenotrophomonas maltophilia]